MIEDLHDEAKDTGFIINPNVPAPFIDGNILYGAARVTDDHRTSYVIGNTPIGDPGDSLDASVYEALTSSGMHAAMRVRKMGIGNTPLPEEAIHAAAGAFGLSCIPELLGTGMIDVDPLSRSVETGMKTRYILVRWIDIPPESYESLPLHEKITYSQIELAQAESVSRIIGVHFVDFQSDVFWDREKGIAYWVDCSKERMRLIPFSSESSRIFIHAIRELASMDPLTKPILTREQSDVLFFSTHPLSYPDGVNITRDEVIEALGRYPEIDQLLKRVEHDAEILKSIARSLLMKFHEQKILLDVTDEDLRDMRVSRELCRLAQLRGEGMEMDFPLLHAIRERKELPKEPLQRVIIGIQSLLHEPGAQNILRSPEREIVAGIEAVHLGDGTSISVDKMHLYIGDENLVRSIEKYRTQEQKYRKIIQEAARSATVALQKENIIGHRQWTDSLDSIDFCRIICQMATGEGAISYGKYPLLFGSITVGALAQMVEPLKAIKQTANHIVREAQVLINSKLLTRSVEALLRNIEQLDKTITFDDVSRVIGDAHKTLEEIVYLTQRTQQVFEAGLPISDRLEKYMIEKQMLFSQSYQSFFLRRIVPISRNLGLDYRTQISKIEQTVRSGQDWVMPNQLTDTDLVSYYDSKYRITGLTGIQAKLLQAIEMYYGFMYGKIPLKLNDDPIVGMQTSMRLILIAAEKSVQKGVLVEVNS